MAPLRKIPLEISPPPSANSSAHLRSSARSQGPLSSAGLKESPSLSSAGKRKATGNDGSQNETKRSKSGNSSEFNLRPSNGVGNTDSTSNVTSLETKVEPQFEMLRASKIENRDLKQTFLACIDKQLDNTKLLVIREELRKAFSDGTYCPITTSLPQTTFLLDLIRRELE